MMNISHHGQSIRSTGLCFLACCTPMVARGFEGATVANPIGRIARVFDPQLVKTEDRVSWLDDRVATFAQRREHAMKVDLGYRGFRTKAGAEDPSVTLDLGADLPIDTVFLVPAQREFLQDPGIFPIRYTIDLSKHPDFKQRTILFTSGSSSSFSSDGNPVPFKAHGSARYVRLTVHQGHHKGMLDLFGLSEIAVISGSDPASFNATVSCNGGSMNVPGIWYPEALKDGRTPLGVWQNGNEPISETGDSVAVADVQDPVSWSLELGGETALDRVILFPFQLNRAFESMILPESIGIYLQSENSGEEKLAYHWKNPVSGASSMTPLVIPLEGQVASRLRVTGLIPHLIGEQKIHALSEIEVWSEGKNVASGLPVTRKCPQLTSTEQSLTDGNTSEKRIASFGIWLDQLAERGRIERELNLLRPVQYQKASESELNATWGSAMILGLTFLIPVFIVERRRLMSREQLDQIRKRIASDLHDDIGSNLGSISLIARTARKDLMRLQGPEEVADDLGEVESIARESSLAMRDIVWLLERRQDSIGDLVQRMRETAGRLLREINYTVECDSHKTAAKLSLDAKRHLFLFYKEAIHNVLKHSHANNVSIRLWDEDDKLALEITDNGIGIPTNGAPDHATVHKLEDRARVLDGLLEVLSSKETGTRIRLFVKRSHLTAHPTLA
ncbi:MAG: sensor histidine kinase [Luteolibacter sp.]